MYLKQQFIPSIDEGEGEGTGGEGEINSAYLCVTHETSRCVRAPEYNPNRLISGGISDSSDATDTNAVTICLSGLFIKFMHGFQTNALFFNEKLIPLFKQIAPLFIRQPISYRLIMEKLRLCAEP